MSFLMDLDAQPVPPQTIVAGLRRIDSRLGLKFFDLGTTGDNPQPQWGIIYTWHPDDPRHQLIKRGDMKPGSNHDLIGTLPFDCPLEQAFGYIENHFKRQATNGRQDVQAILDRVSRYNKVATDEAKQPVMDYANELIEANAGTLFREQGKTTKRVFVRSIKRKKTTKKD